MKTIQSIQKYLLAYIIISYDYNIIQKVNSYLLIPDVDYFGGDMYSIYNVNSSLSCMNYCETIRDCKLATWCENTCYIKNIKTNETQKAGCITIDMYPEITNSLEGSLEDNVDIQDTQGVDEEITPSGGNIEEQSQSTDITSSNTPPEIVSLANNNKLQLSASGLVIMPIIILSIF